MNWELCMGAKLTRLDLWWFILMCQIWLGKKHVQISWKTSSLGLSVRLFPEVTSMELVDWVKPMALFNVRGHHAMWWEAELNNSNSINNNNKTVDGWTCFLLGSQTQSSHALGDFGSQDFRLSQKSKLLALLSRTFACDTSCPGSPAYRGKILSLISA